MTKEIYKTFEQWMNGNFLEVKEPRKKAYSKDELLLVEMGWKYGYDAGRAVEQALDKKAENARELGLDYEPVWCGHCNGSGRMVRDPDIGTDQECFVCDGAGVPEAPVQEPVHQWRQKHSPYWYDGYPDNDDGGGPYETRILYTTPPAQPAPVQEPVAWMHKETGLLRQANKAKGGDFEPNHWTPLYTTPPAAQRPFVGLTDEEILEAAGIDGADTWLFETAYAIEAKLRSKNNG